MLARLTDNHHAGGREGIAEFLDHAIGKRLAVAARERMEQDEGRIFIEARQFVAARKRAAQLVGHDPAGAFGEFEVTLDRVLTAVDFCDAMVEPARAFAGIAHPIDFFCSAHFGDQRAAQ